MIPGKLMIAQRLVEVAHELEAVAKLAEEYRHEVRWPDHIDELARAADLARWWANDIRAQAEAPKQIHNETANWLPFDTEASCS